MKVSYVEDLANRNGPESCGAAREGGVEALIGGRTGRVLSREIYALPRKQQVLRDADAGEAVGRQYRVHRHRKVYLDPARSETPCMYATRSVSALGSFGSLPLLRSAHERACAVRLPLCGWFPVEDGLAPSQPRQSPDLAPHDSVHPAVVSAG